MTGRRLADRRALREVKVKHYDKKGHLLLGTMLMLLSVENSFFILSHRIQRGDYDGGVSRENDSFFLIFTFINRRQGRRLEARHQRWCGKTLPTRPLRLVNLVLTTVKQERDSLRYLVPETFLKENPNPLFPPCSSFFRAHWLPKHAQEAQFGEVNFNLNLPFWVCSIDATSVLVQ